jgi:hypothetical protein
MVTPPSTSAASLSNEGAPGGADLAERQPFSDGVQFRVIRRNTDRVKPHQFGGAYNERCIALWEPRGVRLVAHIDAEHHEYRYFFAHLENLPS